MVEEILPNCSLFDLSDEHSQHSLMQVDAYLSSEEWAILEPHLGHLSVEKKAVAPQDWVVLSQQNFPPVSVGDFYIYGPGYQPSESHAFSLFIEPTCAFGSGHHETTQGCLFLIQEKAKKKKWNNALDLGCGSGILALAMERLHPGHAQGSDCDEEAIVMAQKAAHDHGLSIPFFVEEGLPFGHTYDLIVANLFSYVLCELAPRMKGAQDLILSGILCEQEQDVCAAYKDWTLKKRLVMGSWVSLWFEA